MGIKQWFAIRMIRWNMRHLSDEKKVELVIHAYMEMEINEELKRILTSPKP